MTVYFLFGPTGTGKTYIGHLLRANGVTFIDGDKYITTRMRNCLLKDEQMTPEMIDEFVEKLKDIIIEHKESLGNKSFVIAQALYMNKHRQYLLRKIKELVFVLVKSEQSIREDRIRARFQSKESGVNIEYAKEMDDKFESPSHAHLIINNDRQAKSDLLSAIKDTMPELFVDESEAHYCMTCTVM